MGVITDHYMKKKINEYAKVAEPTAIACVLLFSSEFSLFSKASFYVLTYKKSYSRRVDINVFDKRQ